MNENPEVMEIEKASKSDIQLTSIYNIIFTNDMACSQLAQLIYHIKKSPLNKQQVKQETKRLEQLNKKFEDMIKNVAGPRIYFLSDATQTIECECDEHISLIRKCINEELKNAGHPNHELISYAETARTLTEMACVNVDYRINEMKERKIHDAGSLSYLRMTDLFRSIDRICIFLYKQTSGKYEKKTIDLNKNTECISALRSLEKILTDANVIAKSICEAEKLNPQTEE